MNKEEILAISPGKRLDKLIAEEVMEWHLIPSEIDEEGISWRQMWLDKDNRLMCNDWSPSTNVSDAWDIIEKMEKDDVSFSMADVIPNSDPIAYEFKFIKILSDYYACEFTVPLAICRAALLMTEKIENK